MRFTVTMVLEADSLSDAWGKAFAAIPQNLSPDVIQDAASDGLVSFSLIGDGREIRFGTQTFASGGFIPGTGTMPVGSSISAVHSGIPTKRSVE